MSATSSLSRALLGLASTICLASVAQADVRKFDQPLVDGAPLGYCNAAGTLCGAELARQWCIDVGYDGATNWTLATDATVSPRVSRTGQRGFSSITCGREGTAFRAPTLGPLTRSTIITPNRRAVVTTFDPIEYRLTVPGCYQDTPGVLLCETASDFQHCRSLFRAGKVFGCRAGMAFASGFATPVAALEGSYDLDLRSTAEAIVRSDRRGKGKLRGQAEFSVAFETPVPARGEMCLQRDRYLYYPTGPMGGMAGIEATDACDAPISGTFEPHEDDLLQAYDACFANQAWGQSIESEIELLVAGLYYIAAVDDSGLIKSIDAPGKIEARYLTVRAPFAIHCEL